MRLVQRKNWPAASVIVSVFILATLAVVSGRGQNMASATTAASTPANTWAGTWAASQQIPEPQNALPQDDMRDTTMRQIFHLSTGGKMLRVHLSNAFGAQPLHFTAVHVARPLSPSLPKIDPSSDAPITFSGRGDVVVPAGADYVSDAVNYPVVPLSNIAITFHLDSPPDRETGHPGSRATSYYVHGNFVGSADLPGAKTVDHWYQVSGIDVAGSAKAAAIAAIGDSITDGHATTTNGNNRWTDVLAARLQASAATRSFGVLQ